MSAARNFVVVNNVPVEPLCTAENNARERWLRRSAKSENSRAAYLAALKLFLRASGAESVREACCTYARASASLRAFSASLAGYSVATQRQRLSAIRSLLVLCEREQLFESPVAHLVDAPDPEVKMPYSVPTQENCLECIRLEPDERNRLILRLLYYTGMRVSELVSLRFGDLRRMRDASGRDALCAPVIGKGKRLRWASFRPELEAMLEIGPADERIVPLTRSRVGFICRRAWRRIGVVPEKPGIGAHLWRHCHGTHAVENGAELVKVQGTMGHCRLETTQENYLHLAPDSSGEDLRWG